MAEMPRYSHLVPLMFLGSAFLIFVGLLVAMVAAWRGTPKLAKLAAGGAALVTAGYVALLLGVSLTTKNRTLPPGSLKYFCEADCHIAYSIDSFQETATLGPEAKMVAARGKFVVVRLKTWFDQNSIAPFRGDAPLTPNPRVVKLIDEQGREYLPVPETADYIKGSTPLYTPLRPGESYLTSFVFDVPAEARNPLLLVADSDPITRLIVDHENGPLHGKIYLSLPASSPAKASAGPS